MVAAPVAAAEQCAAARGMQVDVKVGLQGGSTVRNFVSNEEHTYAYCAKQRYHSAIYRCAPSCLLPLCCE